jgi:hypothetical protein
MALAVLLRTEQHHRTSATESTDTLTTSCLHAGMYTDTLFGYPSYLTTCPSVCKGTTQTAAASERSAEGNITTFGEKVVGK